jgi:hypothetical protein
VEKVKEYIPHAATKCLELYGLNIHLSELSNRIRNGRAKFACRSAHPDRNFYFVEVEGKTLKVLFSETDKVVVTVVPPEFQSKVADRKNAKIRRKFFRDLEDDED